MKRPVKLSSFLREQRRPSFDSTFRGCATHDEYGQTRILGGKNLNSPVVCYFASIDQLQRKLKLPRCTCGAGDKAEARSAKKILGDCKVHDIEEVEELGAELHRQGITSTAFANWRILD